MSQPTLRKLIPLKKRKIIKSCMSYLIIVGGLWVVATYFILPLILDSLDGSEYFSQTEILVGWFLMLAVLVLWKTAYPILYFVTYFYDITDNEIIIRKGVLTPREITLPFSKITDVNVDQDAWDLVLGLYDVHISTPTADSGLFAHIDGVNKKGAQQLKKLILDNIHLKESGEEPMEELIERKALPE